MTRPLPETFGRYQILRPLGEGGMGSVYLARDTQLDRLVALKVPRLGDDDNPASDEFKRFFREARAAAALLHANLCPIFDVGEIEGTPYLTMAYLEGQLLSDLIKEKKRLSDRQATLIVRKLGLAMQEAHARGVIHRDLKPSNVMITPRGEPVIMDFGLARLDQAAEARLTKAGAVLGTPAYMAPEQVLGDPLAIGPACDIYALGVILYQLLTGHLPFEGSVMSVLGRILTEEPPPPSKHRSDLDPRFEAICLKAMAKKPEDRYASMADLAAALTAELRTIRETSTNAPVAGPESRAASDPAATLAAENSYSGHEPERPRSAAQVSGRGPSWRNRQQKSQRMRLPVSGWLLSAMAGGAVSLFLLGYALFAPRVNDGGGPGLPAVAPPVRPKTPSTPSEPQSASPRSQEVVRKEPEPRKEMLPPLAKKGAELKSTPLLSIVEKKGQAKNEMLPHLVKKETEPKPVRPKPVVERDVQPKNEPPPRLVKKETEPKPARPKPVVDPRVLTTHVGLIKLKRIPAGSFRMGSPESEGFPNEHPRHAVRITRPFYLGIFEVTQAQYHAVMAVNPSWYSITGGGKDKVAGESTDQHPVHNVSWLDAVRFCNTLSQRERLKPYYEINGAKVKVHDWNGTGYRLPTEAEWEYACRAGSNTRYSFGDSEQELWDYAWYARLAIGRTRVVGQKRPNPWGLFDMHGNVWEWCWDWHDENFYRRALHNDPMGPSVGTHRVLRGGSFVDYPASLRSAIRGREVPAGRDRYNGLRIARTCDPI